MCIIEQQDTILGDMRGTARATGAQHMHAYVSARH
jgi:hypothetical protein